MVPSEALVNGKIVAIADYTVHEGHIICTKDCENITLTVKNNNLWKQFNIFNANFGQLCFFVKKYNCFVSSAAAFMDHHCDTLQQCNHYVLFGGNH